ncbi:MAG: hydratase [Rhodospirillaceae bacterium]|nr:hydratase [Rhodospirillaceae bacterium]|tara:strand:- start:6002 stop:6790 length:789 start_codon:yes stop_codon:yes gene_type:complete
MSPDNNFKEAAKILWKHWSEGTVIDQFPISMQPKTQKEGYIIQNFFAEFSKSKVIGRKIAATSIEGQQHIGITHPIQGLLIDNFCFDEGNQIPNHGIYMACAEPEFAFSISEDLLGSKGKYTQENIFESISSLFLALEIPETRLKNFNTAGAEQLIADNGCAGYFVLGNEVTNWRSVDLVKTKVRVYKDGDLHETGEGKAAYGGPLNALAWLANDAINRGYPIKKNEIITTGTCTKPIRIQKGSKIKAIFEGLGEVATQIEN